MRSKLNMVKNERTFCAVISKEHMLEPSFVPVNHDFDFYLVFEFPRPWHRKIDKTKNFPKGLNETIKKLTDNGKKVKILAITPNESYHDENKRIIMLYHNPKSFVKEFPKTELHVPEEKFDEVINDVLLEKNESYASYVIRNDLRDIFICNHGNRDACCGKFGYDIFLAFKQYAGPHTRIWLCSHLGGHRLAPTAIDMPSGRVYSYLTSPVVKQLLSNSGDHYAILPSYRGTMGLDPKGQILEKQIFARVGWKWFDYERRSVLIANDETSFLSQIHYQNWPVEGYYEAKLVYDGLMFLDQTDCSNGFEVTKYLIKDLKDHPKPKKKVIVKEYNSSWPLQFDNIGNYIRKRLDHLIIGIEHVGSTSVPNLSAKPIIDIDIIIHKTNFPQVKAILEDLGYFHRGNLGIVGRDAFGIKEQFQLKSFPSHHLYVCDENSTELKRHLAFRDYLRLHPDICEEYSQLKIELATKFPEDIEGYLEGKASFIQIHLNKALES